MARPSYPFQVILLVENVEALTLCEKQFVDEINEATSKYDIPMTIREYDLFHPHDSAYVKYLPSYHIYKKSKWKSTHSTSGNVEKHLAHCVKKYEADLTKQVLRPPQPS